MSHPLATPTDYEFFIYTLGEQFPSIRRSTVHLCSVVQPWRACLVRYTSTKTSVSSSVNGLCIIGSQRSSMSTATKSGKGRKNFTGMTPSRTQLILIYRAPIRITNTFHRI
jgi:hypothetical protein